MPFVITIVMVLLTDLLEGVAIGLLISIYFLVRNNFKAEYKIEKHRESATDGDSCNKACKSRFLRLL